jgi:hypothetical protein
MLDRHVESSVPTGGLMPGGHSEFDTTRTELGELIYQLKYGGRRDDVPIIARAMAESREVDGAVRSTRSCLLRHR